MSALSRVFRCVGCQITLTVATDAKVPARTLGWLANAVMRCPVCVSQLDREGVRASSGVEPLCGCGRAGAPHVHRLTDECFARERAAYEPPAIESTRELSAVQQAMLVAANLTAEQVEERKRIGAAREPLRIAALERHHREGMLHAAAPCVCSHSRGAHTPDCEQCDCDRFDAAPVSARGKRLALFLRSKRLAP